MIDQDIQKIAHLRTLTRALNQTREILIQPGEARNYDEVHRVKSILYAAIEQMSMKAERLIFSQRLLRELFSIVTMKGDIREHERLAGLQILQELDERCQKEIVEIRQKDEVISKK